MRYKQLIYPEEVRLYSSDYENVDLSSLKNKTLQACRQITFQITTQCNLNCDYCYECNKDNKVMSKETAKRICDLILNQIANNNFFFDRQYMKGLVLEFIGGEPFLYVDLIDYIVKYFINKLYYIAPEVVPFVRLLITTNGMNFLTEKVQEFCTKYQSIMDLTVSIDGVKELHDAHRVDRAGTPSYDVAYKSFLKAKEMGWNRSKMTFVPDSFNFIYSSIIKMIKEGMQEINCNYAYEPIYSYSDAKILYDQLVKVSDYLFDNNLSQLYISILDQEIGLKNIENDNYCGGTGNMLSFDPDGNAYPCLRYHPSSLGDKSKEIQVGDLSGIFQKKEHIKVMDYLSSITYESQSSQECINCPISQGCGWCSAYNYEIYGTANKRVTNICNAHKGRVLAHYYYINNRSLLWRDCKPQETSIPREWALKIISEKEFDQLNNIYIKAKSQFEKEPESYVLDIMW